MTTIEIKCYICTEKFRSRYLPLDDLVLIYEKITRQEIDITSETERIYVEIKNVSF